ncbi:uncharacterized protein LOC101857550 [Aplysia californica]|uniref:Uncharacterized protein LOC101857550 n=1 Tax=Aplysia californica TaxID=6500 RepID=A0ABM0JGR3_APLCA|nr:uncharacterized protein LOC101857550 [Aplysia californica]
MKTYMSVVLLAMSLVVIGAQVPEEAERGGRLCFLCERVVQRLRQLLQESSPAQIESGLDRLCDFAPVPLRPKCENLVQQRGSLLVQLLQHIPKDRLCILICRSNNAEN